MVSSKSMDWVAFWAVALGLEKHKYFWKFLEVLLELVVTVVETVVVLMVVLGSADELLVLEVKFKFELFR